MATKKTKAEPSPLRSQQREAALQEYEKGIRLLQQKDFKKALPRFETILEQYPAEVALCDRARTYVRIARGEVESRRPVRSTRDPALAFEVGIYLLNDGEAKEALHHLEKAVAHEPEEAGVHVALASARYQCEDVPGCLDALKKAIELDDNARYRVRNMSDFEGLASNEEFDALVAAKR